ncbi:MAG TPA: aminodeoxychorismate synthase component I [Phycisphaerae bacterium]|nr:aminodeoxychorismate synthase component I [Phycisphaerae bacterium]
MAHDTRVRCYSRTIDPPGNVAALRRAIAARPGAAMLESHGESDGRERYSIYGWDPVARLTVPTTASDDPFKSLAHRSSLRQAVEVSDVPFAGGWIGYMAYEAGRCVEPSAGWGKPDPRLPLAHWGLYDTLLVHDQRTNHWAVSTIEVPEICSGGRPVASERIGSVERFVRASRAASDSGRADAGRLKADGRWNFDRAAYVAKVGRAMDYIRAGDIFQVNLARRFRAEWKGDASALYERLIYENPSPYAAYLDVPGGQIVSSSPELFLELRNRVVVTRPIKGTRPRGATAAGDEEARRALENSEKDRAELNMIVDLERNDLGRICEYGSVRVVEDGRIEAYPTVFHRTATIVGRLREDAGAIDLLRAAFPGGSITGAPKVRAMQIINELEPDPRGAYCGAIGYVGLDGSMQLNLAIRTMSLVNGQVDLSVGSAIVADSDPEEEYQELAAKAAGMLAALGIREGAAPVRSGGYCKPEPALS